MKSKSITILVINIVLSSLSIRYQNITPFALMCLVLYSFYLTLKLEEYKNIILNLVEETKKKIKDDKEKVEKDLNTVYHNQQTILSIINTLRTRINNFYGKTQKAKIPSFRERLSSIEQRESNSNKD